MNELHFISLCMLATDSLRAGRDLASIWCTLSSAVASCKHVHGLLGRCMLGVYF